MVKMNSSDDATGRNISEDDLNFLDFREDAEESFFGEETFFFFKQKFQEEKLLFHTTHEFHRSSAYIQRYSAILKPSTFYLHRVDLEQSQLSDLLLLTLLSFFPLLSSNI